MQFIDEANLCKNKKNYDSKFKTGWFLDVNSPVQCSNKCVSPKWTKYHLTLTYIPAIRMDFAAKIIKSAWLNHS